MNRHRLRLSGLRLSLVEWGVQILWWASLAAVAFGVARLVKAEALGAQTWNGTTTYMFIGGGVAAMLAGAAVWWLCHAPDDDGGPIDIASFVPDLPPAPECDLIATLLLLVDPSRYSPRTVERVSFQDGYYRHAVSRDFVVPVVDPHPSLIDQRPSAWRRRLTPEVLVLFPVLRLGRDVVIDNLELQTAEGARINTLNVAECLAVTRELIRNALRALIAADTLDSDVESNIDKLMRQGRFAHRRQPKNAEAAAREVALQELIHWIDSVPLAGDYQTDLADWQEVRQRVARLCNAVAHDHIVFAPLRAVPGERVVVNYGYTAPHHPKSRRPLWRRVWRWVRTTVGETPKDPIPMRLGLRDSVRYHLGLRPHVHRIPITTHRWSQSYHLEFAAPLEAYVYSCAILDRPRSDSDPPGTIVTYPPEGSRGGDYVHFYLREAARTEYRDRPTMVAEIDCREKPPGLLGNVAILAAAQAVLIWIIGWHVTRFFGQSEKAIDLPALLLALPGLVTGWLGAQFSGERLRSVSIATLFGILGTGFLAIASTGVALSKSQGDAIEGFFGIVHPVWLTLMALSLVLVIDLLCRGALRTRRYVRRINIPGEDRTTLV